MSLPRRLLSPFSRAHGAARNERETANIHFFSFLPSSPPISHFMGYDKASRHRMAYRSALLWRRLPPLRLPDGETLRPRMFAKQNVRGVRIAPFLAHSCPSPPPPSPSSPRLSNIVCGIANKLRTVSARERSAGDLLRLQNGSCNWVNWYIPKRYIARKCRL